MRNTRANAQDVKAEVVERNPRLYAETMSATHAGFFAETLRWVVEALWHSAVALAVPLLALWAPDSSGKSSGGLAAFGTTAYTAIVLIVNLKVKAAPQLTYCDMLHSCLLVAGVLQLQS